jgi:hypothetical protein
LWFDQGCTRGRIYLHSLLGQVFRAHQSLKSATYRLNPIPSEPHTIFCFQPAIIYFQQFTKARSNQSGISCSIIEPEFPHRYDEDVALDKDMWPDWGCCSPLIDSAAQELGSVVAAERAW